MAEVNSKEPQLHYTCTSTPLEKEPGSKREWINKERLDALYKEQTGTPISNDPAVAIIQREQALVKHKRENK